MNTEASYSPSFSGGNCLSTGFLREYIDGSLSRKNVHEVEKHLLDCDFCSQVLEDMDLSQEASPDISSIAKNVNARISDLVGPAPKIAFWTRPGAYFAAGGAALLLLIGGGVLYHFANQPEKQNNPISATSHLAVQPLPPSNTSSLPISDTSRNLITEEEFSTHKTTIQPSSGASRSVENPAVASATPVPPESPKSESSASSVPNVANQTDAVADPPNKEVTSSEISVRNENYANLQIVNVKVLQKMTKTSGNSRKAARNGQLSVPRDRGATLALPEDMPAFPGGDEMLEDYVATHFKNPVKDKRTLTGKAVGVMFTVTSRGKIADIEITHSIDPELDVEIIRLISAMPQWEGGKHNAGDITCVLALTVK